MLRKRGLDLIFQGWEGNACLGGSEPEAEACARVKSTDNAERTITEQAGNSSGVMRFSGPSRNANIMMILTFHSTNFHTTQSRKNPKKLIFPLNVKTEKKKSWLSKSTQMPQGRSIRDTGLWGIGHFPMQGRLVEGQQ